MKSSAAMEGKGTLKELAQSTPELKVAVAVAGSKNSVMVIKWALESFVSDVKVQFKLLHVRAPIKSTTQDDKITVRCFPVAQVHEDMIAKYKKDVERQTIAMLLPFKQLCQQRKVEVDITVIEGNDIADAIMKEISYSKITKLVIGASPRTMFTRKVKINGISSRILEGAPGFCAVYVVSKGNLSSMRPSNPEVSPPSTAEREIDVADPYNRRSSSAATCIEQPDDESRVFGKATTLEDNGSGLSEEFTFNPVMDAVVSRQFDKWFIFGSNITSKVSSYNDNGSRDSGQSYFLEENGSKPIHRRYTSDTTIETGGSSRFDRGSSFNKEIDTGPRIFGNTLEENRLKGSAFGAVLSTTQSMPLAKASTFEDKESREFPVKGFTLEVTTDVAKIFDQTTMLEAPWSSSSLSSDGEDDIVQELEGLGVDRGLLNTLYSKSQRETTVASSQNKHNSSTHWMEQMVKPHKETFKEDNTRELVRSKKEEDKYDTVKQKEIESTRELDEAEAKSDAQKKRKLQKVTVLQSDELCNMFTWEDVVSATSSLSNDLLIGKGRYGSVYKCKLHHTTTAVKILHSKEGHWTKQFHQELEILSKAHHPHLLLLLGSCPEHGCLVYEYMEKGSLEDRLFRKDNTSPIPWFERFRIAWEVASALLFLHEAKPKPIIHCDLKPANILLDHNYTSKIGDVGLSKLFPVENATVFKGTSLGGTICYIDPEYQRTGMISRKSDVYAFGMVILQLLTAKPAIALTRLVEKALDNGQLMGILDLEAGNWPVKETRELATLGLSCTELRHRDRPDLKTRILPVLEKLKVIAERARDSRPCTPSSAPQYFICPILQDVMDEPCVAADGYTYDRKAIEEWLKNNDRSPITYLPLSSKNLLQNYTLNRAIMEWKSKKQ